MRTSEITLPKLLKEKGYATCHSGKWHLNGKFNSPDQPQPNDHGYDHWMATQNNAGPNHKNPTNFVRNGKAVGKLEGFSAQLVVDEAIEWLNNGRDKSKPFFLAVWTHEPHQLDRDRPEVSEAIREDRGPRCSAASRERHPARRRIRPAHESARRSEADGEHVRLLHFGQRAGGRRTHQAQQWLDRRAAGTQAIDVRGRHPRAGHCPIPEVNPSGNRLRCPDHRQRLLPDRPRLGGDQAADRSCD